jgi:hypothetical protein
MSETEQETILDTSPKLFVFVLMPFALAGNLLLEGRL